MHHHLQHVAMKVTAEGGKKKDHVGGFNEVGQACITSTHIPLDRIQSQVPIIKELGNIDYL